MDGSAPVRPSTRCVVVIDSDASALERTRVLLAREGREIVTATSAEEVRTALTGVRPFAVVIEPVLADADGFSLCRSILDGYESDPPVVILASKRLKGKAAFLRAREVGAFIFIERPAQDRSLVDTIAHFESRGGLKVRNPPPAPASSPDEQAPAVGGVPVGNTEISAKPIDLSRASSGEFEHWIDDAFATFTDAVTLSPPESTGAIGPADEDPTVDDGPTEEVTAAQGDSGGGDLTETFDVDELLSAPSPMDAREDRAEADPADSAAGPGLGTDPPVAGDPIGSALEDAFSGFGGASGGSNDARDVPAAPAPARPAVDPADQRPAQAPAIAASATSVMEADVDPFEGVDVIDVGTARVESAVESTALVPAREVAAALPAPTRTPVEPPSHGPALAGPLKLILGGLAAAVLVAAGLLIGGLLPWNRAAETVPVRTRYVPVITNPEPLPSEGTVLGAGLADDPLAPPAPAISGAGAPGANRPARGTDVAARTPGARTPAERTTTAPIGAPKIAARARAEPVATATPRATPALPATEPAARPDAGAAAPSGPNREDAGTAAVMAGVVPLAEAADLDAVEQTAAPDTAAADGPARSPDAPAVMPMPAVIVEPRPIRSTRVEPRYPIAARRVRASGEVLLRVTVTETGGVSDIEVLAEPEASLGFGAAAMDAVRRWRFEPATRDGAPVARDTTVKIVFSP